MGGHVFISYSQAQRPYAADLAAFLERAQLTVWLDENAERTQLARSLANKIDRCSAFIVILTPEARESASVLRQISYALDVGAPILPIRLEPCAAPALLAGIHLEDVDDGRMPSFRYVQRLHDRVDAAPAPRRSRRRRPW